MLKKNILFVGITLLAVVVVVIGGAVIINFALSHSAAPSGPITALPLAVGTATPGAVEPAAVGATANATGASASAAQGSGPVVFQISPEQSEVRFSIFEELGGQPNTVVGKTNQVAGQLAVDMQDLSQTQAGVIQVDARALATDNNRRNGAMRNFILNTNQYEFITFTPTALTGLSGAAQTGQSFTFQIAGNLTIRDVTHPVVFDVTAQGESPTRITGTATAVVKRSDFNLTIPSVPNVANVGEEVTLNIDFVAEAATD